MEHTVVMAKVRWLQKHYKPYSSEWYLEDLRKLDAIYGREYSNYMQSVKAQVQSKHMKTLNNRRRKLSDLYREQYGTDMREDMKVDKKLVQQRCKGIKV